MKKTVIGLFDSFTGARLAIGKLEQDDFGSAEISVVARDDVVKEHLDKNQAQLVLESAGAGALGGTALGGLIGLLAGAGTLLLPGIGSVLAVGPIAAAVGSLAAGAAYGGFMGALIGLGMSEEAAHRYVEAVKQGNLLITVETEPERASAAEKALREAEALDVEIRSGGWEVSQPDPQEKVTTSVSGEIQAETIEALQDLIEACHKSKNGFQMAAKNVRDERLEQLFDRQAEQYEEFISVLGEQIQYLGGRPPEGERISKAIERGWTNIKATMTSEEKNTQAVVLTALKEGEVKTMERYRAVLSEELPEQVHAIVAEQYAQIKEAHTYLRTLAENESQ